jgi:hypothetical protein
MGLSRLRDHRRHHAQQCAGTGGQHVFLGIPFVSLGPQIGSAQLRTYDLGNERFHNLKEPALGKHATERQIVGPEALYAGQPDQNLAQGIGEEQAVGEVDQPIERIAGQSEPML